MGRSLVAVLMADTPHFNVPFRLRASAEEIEQDTVDDIANSVVIVTRTPLAWRPEAPEIGIPDLTFLTQPIGTDYLRDLIVELEPRAAILIEEHPDVLDELVDRIKLEITARGGSST